ncbi:hypothetical protein [Halioglobus sp. HI00S01]|uniref:hypothetical protein n=1 Tax=Halioglobus sp. HI00S01 TaxID=1822214 RepID=UPI0012E755B4|nr:hypothetical protein [Halioglobus sp. HI00S01]
MSKTRVSACQSSVFCGPLARQQGRGASPSRPSLTPNPPPAAPVAEMVQAVLTHRLAVPGAAVSLPALPAAAYRTTGAGACLSRRRAGDGAFGTVLT